jgi:hypothetical protein
MNGCQLYRGQPVTCDSLRAATRFAIFTAIMGGKQKGRKCWSESTAHTKRPSVAFNFSCIPFALTALQSPQRPEFRQFQTRRQACASAADLISVSLVGVLRNNWVSVVCCSPRSLLGLVLRAVCSSCLGHHHDESSRSCQSSCQGPTRIFDFLFRMAIDFNLIPVSAFPGFPGFESPCFMLASSHTS